MPAVRVTEYGVPEPSDVARKSGENPARSRHCDQGANSDRATVP